MRSSNSQSLETRDRLEGTGERNGCTGKEGIQRGHCWSDAGSTRSLDLLRGDLQAEGKTEATLVGVSRPFRFVHVGYDG